MRLLPFLFCFVCWGTVEGQAQLKADPDAREAAESLPPVFAQQPSGLAPQVQRETSFKASETPRARTTSAALSEKITGLVMRSLPTRGESDSRSGTAVTPAGSPDAIQLERYTVRERPLPRFKERELLTAKGKLALARRRYPGLGPLTDTMALMRLEDDFAAERRREVDDLEELVGVGAEVSAPDMKRLFDAARFRPADFRDR